MRGMTANNARGHDGAETLEFFIEDARYGVPSLHILTCPAGGVAAMAERLLRQSANHRNVEVRRHGQIIYSARRYQAAADMTDKPDPA